MKGANKGKAKAGKKRERNRRRQHSIRARRKEKIAKVFAVSKELDEKKNELAMAKRKLEQTKLNALQLTKQLTQQQAAPPKLYNWSKRDTSSRFCIRTKPTASSGLRSSQFHISHLEQDSQCSVNRLDRYSLKDPSSIAELGNGSFGKCTKMILCSTEVAVKTTVLDSYSRANIMYEAMIMTKVCSGHPNLPLFMGVYDHLEHKKPLLVTKFYSVAGKSCTLHQYLQQQLASQSIGVQEWAALLMGVCCGLEHVHDKGYLHNDLKCDNIVLSDCLPAVNSKLAVWPIIIDFGKARPVESPRRYKLSKKEQDEHLSKFTHLDPELIQGLCSQSISTDVYSLGRVIRKVAQVSSHNGFKSTAKLCLTENVTIRPSILFVKGTLSDLK